MQAHISTVINMKSNHNNNRSSSNSKDLKIFPSSLNKQERSTSTESTISTGHNIKDMILSPIAACKSPSTNVVTPPGYCFSPPQSAPSSPPPVSPKHEKSNHNRQNHIGRRKSAVYRNRTSPPLCTMKSLPKTRSRSTPSLLSISGSHGEEKCKGQTSPAAAAILLLNGEILDKAVQDHSGSDAESSYSYSSRDQLLSNNNNIHDKAMISRQQQPQSCSSYDCNYKYSQESAYEDFGVERKLIDKINKKGQSSSAQQSSERGGEKKKKKKMKHLIRLRQSVSAQSQAVTPPNNKSLVTGMRKPTSHGGSPSTLPPSGKSSSTRKVVPPPAVVRRSAPPTYFEVDITEGSQYSSSSVGYHSAPIETELRPDRSLSQMGMEVTEEDYCIEGEYMARQFQKQEQQQRHHTVSGYSTTNHKGRSNNKKANNESAFSMKELTKGLEGLSTRNPCCSPKTLKTKVLSALRRGNNSSDTVATKDAAASDKKKRIPHQIAITVTPSTSEDTGDDHLSLDDMKLLYKWQHARSRRDVNQFSSSRVGVVSCSTDDNFNHVEMAVTKRISDDVTSITSSVGDRTVSVDNRRCSVKRQFSF